MVHSTICVAVSLLLFTCLNVSNAFFLNADSDSNFTHQTALDSSGSFHLFWKFDNDTITFEYHAETKGWAGMGFSPNGAMVGADIVLFWIDQSGKGFVSDRHGGKTNGFPPEDIHQDYNLIKSSRNGTHLVVTFSRKRNTCDLQDWALTDDTTRVIYAANDNIPTDKNNFEKHSRRGSKSVHFFDKGLVTEDNVPPEANATKMEILVTKAIVSKNESTLYYCEFLHIAKVAQKTQIIKIEPAIQENNTDVVHHMLVYMCPSNMSQYLGQGQACYGNDNEVTRSFGKCNQLLLGWAVGGESITYPPDLGMPLPNDNEDVFLMIEVHYNNPSPGRDIIDHSGMRVWLTEKLRPTSTGQASFGIPVDPEVVYQVIPPGVANFTSYAYCNAQSTSGFPKEGVNIIGGMLHTHLSGSKVRLLHYRQEKQLPNILSDEYYDFNYQDYKRKTEPTLVLPGDELVVECVYDTTKRNRTTFSGLPTTDEMCFVYAEYYPAVYRGFACLSFTNQRELYSTLGIKFAPLNNTNDDQVLLPNGDTRPLGRYLKNDFDFGWNKENITRFQELVRDLTHTVFCVKEELNNSNETVKKVTITQQNGYFNVTQPLQVEDQCKKAAASKEISITVLIISAIFAFAKY